MLYSRFERMQQIYREATYCHQLARSQVSADLLRMIGEMCFELADTLGRVKEWQKFLDEVDNAKSRGMFKQFNRENGNGRHDENA